MQVDKLCKEVRKVHSKTGALIRFQGKLYLVTSNFDAIDIETGYALPNFDPTAGHEDVTKQFTLYRRV